LKIMTIRTVRATPVSPLWTNLESALRLTLRALSAPSATSAAFEALEGEQARIRRTGRHWLLG
jgi:hypothetical protein